MSDRISTDQLFELLSQDRESGLGNEVQGVIARRATIKSPDGYFGYLLHRQWICVGKPSQRAKTEAQYCELFPKRPDWSARVHRHHTLLLPVDPCIPLGGLCGGFKIAYGGDNGTFEPWDEAQERPGWKEPHWMWCQSGPWFFNWEPRNVRDGGCAEKEWSLSALEGVHVWGLTGPYPYVTDCPRSVRCDDRGRCASLKLFDGWPELLWYGDDRALPRYGAGSRGE